MNLEACISAIERCEDQEALNGRLQQIVELAGFDSYCFLDTGAPHLEQPYYTGTTGVAWETEYAQNNFINVDACIKRARRTNRPFTWQAVPLPERTGKRKPGALKTLEAAFDHGFREGFVIPFHFADDRGLVHSSVCTLFWKDKPRDFYKTISTNSRFFHLILLYWSQRSIEVRQKGTLPGNDNVTVLNHYALVKANRALTDRERDVISWAARGKTISETAEILQISSETVQTHIKHCIQKLEAGNKTHAVAKAVHLGLVDI